jgi:hypothetical protein
MSRRLNFTGHTAVTKHLTNNSIIKYTEILQRSVQMGGVS